MVIGRASALLVGALALGATAASLPQSPPAASPEGGASAAEEPVVFDERELQRILALSPLGEPPLDATNRFDGDGRAEELGRFFFFDRELSANGEISCATCHDPAQEFSDGKPVAHTLAPGPRRTPSLWNMAWGRWFFHDGRADSLWSQALGPIENEIEMGGSRSAVAHRIAGEPGLRRAFEALRGPLPELGDRARFPLRAHPGAPGSPEAAAWAAMAPADRAAIDAVYADVGKLIAAYERQLVSANAPFDRFVAGLREDDATKRAALGESARRGLRLFLGKGQCRLCHNGPNFSDGEFHGLGLATKSGGMPTDSGRYGGVPQLLASDFTAAGAHSDDPGGERAAQLEGLKVGPANWGEFKTPSLRNVARRGPLMHAGQFADVAAVLEFYSTLEGSAPLHQHQEQVLVARDFSEGEKRDLAAFLESLGGAPLDGRWSVPPLASEFGAPPGPVRSVPKEHDR